MIGLSLSFCVRDILQGHVKEADVTLIVADTRADNAVAMDIVLESYGASYWSTDPEGGKAIALRLLEAGKVFQPRLYNRDGCLLHSCSYDCNCFNIGDGHWVRTDYNGVEAKSRTGDGAWRIKCDQCKHYWDTISPCALCFARAGDWYHDRD